MNNNTSKFMLGVDIGGTNTKLGLVTKAGSILQFQSMPTNAHGTDPASFLRRLQGKITELLNLAVGTVGGIGISTHGYVDDKRNGPITCLNTPALQGVNYRKWITDNFNLPVEVNNDLTAHALGEYYFGCGQGSRRFMSMAVGTGLGAGMIIDGVPLRLIGGTAGDTSRLILETDAEVACSYGVRGSAEALCGVPAIERLAKKHYGRSTPAHHVIAAAKEGKDETAVAIITEIGRYLGHTIASLSTIFLPERIALTGGTTAAGDILLNACQQRFTELVGDYHHTLTHLMGDQYSGVEIMLGTSGPEAGIMGAVAELFQHS